MSFPLLIHTIPEHSIRIIFPILHVVELSGQGRIPQRDLMEEEEGTEEKEEE